ncbi:unnamed protein product [Pseudo-nitzschia multistriata]|uniref:Uncharacterized protein n=1 Tax=Pseudo-nitzschia multistriata TaxID=183589 RepID=A0A448ZCE1_9STRA|nr:unnamed protein product [Pseudo-nitzschia multistriata]
MFSFVATTHLDDLEDEVLDEAVEETPLLPKLEIESIGYLMSVDDEFERENIDNRLSGLSDCASDISAEDTSDCKFHLGDDRVSIQNVHVSPRRTPSYENFGVVYNQVPTQIRDNRKLVVDLNLLEAERGRLYLAEQSFFNGKNPPKYAITIRPSLYMHIMNDINSSFTSPCGLYFCCHGGDGAHTGVSTDDFVHIQLAWVIVIFVLALLLIVEFTSS